MFVKNFFRNNKENLSKGKFFKPLHLTLVALLLFLVGSSVQILQAQNAPNYGQNTSQTGAPAITGNPEEDNKICQLEMKNFIDVELKRYRDFMETHFQNKSSTSSLLDAALERYKEFRKAVNDKFSQFSPQPLALLASETIEPGACFKQVQAALQEAKRSLTSKARQTSAVKQTTALIRQYQHMNEQLRTLSESFLTMKAYLDTFATKLPCYVRKSCLK